MRDRNAYENSSVWNMVSEIKQDEYINSLSPGMRNYLMYLLEDIERRKNTNCYYVSESTLNYICLFNYLFISSQMSAKPYFIGSTGILLLW